MGEKKDKIFYILPEQSTNEAENKFKYDMVIQQPLILQKKKKKQSFDVKTIGKLKRLQRNWQKNLAAVIGKAKNRGNEIAMQERMVILPMINRIGKGKVQSFVLVRKLES